MPTSNAMLYAIKICINMDIYAYSMIIHINFLLHSAQFCYLIND